MDSSLYSPSDDPLLADRKILIGAPIDDRSAQLTIAKLLYLQMRNGNAPIFLYINSPGGSVTASLAIVDTIKGLRPAVHTFATSHCEGAALLILAVGTPGQRLAQKDANLSIEPTEPGASVPQAKAELYLPRLIDKMAAILSQHTKLTTAQALEALDKGKRLSVQEALTLGFIDWLVEFDRSIP